jgi:hypothetical protein
MSKAYQDGIADGEAGRPPTPGRRGAYACGYVIGSGREAERKMAEALAGKNDVKATPMLEATWRTCACGSGQFTLVGFRNATWVWCQHCDAPPFVRSAMGHLGRKAMTAEEIAAFKAALPERAR